MTSLRYRLRYMLKRRQESWSEITFDSKGELLQYLESVLSVNSEPGGCLEITIENSSSITQTEGAIHEKCKECISYPKACSGTRMISKTPPECFSPKPR